MASPPGGTDGPSRVSATSAPANQARTTLDLGIDAGWWPIAFSKDVRRHPRAFRLGSRDLALYRDLTDTVRAVDDVCPHRRLPLSMGRITEDGYLQCAYHGWCFDGATGRCTAIPHLGEEERVPGNIRIAAFTTAENVADLFGWSLRTPALAPRVGPPQGEEPDDGTTMFAAQVAHGFVLVWSGPGEPAEPLPLVQEAEQAHDGPWRHTSGLIDVRAPHERVVEAIALNPGRALGLGWLIGAGEELWEPDVETMNGALVIQRERYTLALPRPSTFQPLHRGVTSSRIAIVPDTGLSTITVDDEHGAPSVRVTIGLTPVGDYRCTVRWRLQVRQRRLAVVGLARSATSLQRLVRRAERTVEAVADEVADNRFDKGLIRLREARAKTAIDFTQQQT